MSKRGRLVGVAEDVSATSRPRVDCVERELAMAMFQGNSSGAPKLPWETNPFLRGRFGPSSSALAEPSVDTSKYDICTLSATSEVESEKFA